MIEIIYAPSPDKQKTKAVLFVPYAIVIFLFGYYRRK